MNSFPNMRLSPYAPLVLRLGLSAVVLWFGVSQLIDAESWTIWVPGWVALFGLTPIAVVYLNGTFEVLFSSVLALGFFARPVAFLLFLHVFGIALLVGINAIGVRDFGIAAGFLALAFWESPLKRA